MTKFSKLSNNLGGLVYPIIFLPLICLLFEILNKPNKIFYLLALLQLALCKTTNKSNRIFYFLIFNSSTICNQLELSDKYRYQIYIIKVLSIIWFARHINLICKLCSNFCFKKFEKLSFINIIPLIRLSQRGGSIILI